MESLHDEPTKLVNCILQEEMVGFSQIWFLLEQTLIYMVEDGDRQLKGILYELAPFLFPLDLSSACYCQIAFE